MRTEVEIIIEKVHPDAKLPTYAHGPEEDACADLYSVEDATIPPGETRTLATGLLVEVPRGFYWDARPRSGLAFNFSVTLINAPGTIDCGYRDQVKVGLVNLGQASYTVHKGDRIAQVALKEVIPQKFIRGKVSDPQRRQGGFGSSGR